MGFAFPREERDALVQTDPGEVPGCRGPRTCATSGSSCRLDAIGKKELRELVFDAWPMVVPKGLAAKLGRRGSCAFVRDPQ